MEAGRERSVLCEYAYTFNNVQYILFYANIVKLKKKNTKK